MNLLWYGRAWSEYCEWQNKDKKKLHRINQLIQSIRRTPTKGIGKPEPLKGDLNHWWSRRIDDTNRLVYRQLDDNTIVIASCMKHYSTK